VSFGGEVVRRGLSARAIGGGGRRRCASHQGRPKTTNLVLAAPDGDVRGDHGRPAPRRDRGQEAVLVLVLWWWRVVVVVVVSLSLSLLSLSSSSLFAAQSVPLVPARAASRHPLVPRLLLLLVCPAIGAGVAPAGGRAAGGAKGGEGEREGEDAAAADRRGAGPGARARGRTLLRAQHDPAGAAAAEARLAA
jgi:hypothetical protein